MRTTCIFPRYPVEQGLERLYPVDAPALRVCEMTKKRIGERCTIRWLKALDGDCDVHAVA